MRIIVTADTHLNINRRFRDFLKSMEQIQEFALKKKADEFWFLGDAYHNRRPHPVEQRAFEKWIKGFLEAGIKCLLLIGNHDQNNEENTLGEFEALSVEGVEVVKSPCIRYGIYLGHHLIREAKLGPINYVLNEKETIGLKELLNKYKDVKLFLLGHVHKRQILNRKPSVIYVGSVERVDFGERNEKKSFLYIDTDKRTLKFIPLKTRKMVQIEYDLTKGEKLIFPDFFEAIVKLVIRCDKQTARGLSEKDIREKTNAYDLRIQFDVMRDKRVRNERIKESSSVEDCFREYSREKHFSKRVIDAGLNLIGRKNE